MVKGCRCMYSLFGAEGSQTDNKAVVFFLSGSLVSLLPEVVLVIVGILVVAGETAFRIGCSIGLVRYVTFFRGGSHD